MLKFAEAREKLEKTIQGKKKELTNCAKTKLGLSKQWKNKIDFSLYAPYRIGRLYRCASFVF